MNANNIYAFIFEVQTRPLNYVRRGDAACIIKFLREGYSAKGRCLSTLYYDSLIRGFLFCLFNGNVTNDDYRNGCEKLKLWENIRIGRLHR